jgi:hypothetical protein
MGLKKVHSNIFFEARQLLKKVLATTFIVGGVFVCLRYQPSKG